MPEQRLARGVLLASALAFAGPGLGFLLAPDRLAAWLDLGLGGATSRSDVRAVMGGLELGLAFRLAACALRPGRLLDGIGLQIAALAGLVAGRLASLARDGAPGGLAWLLFTVELVLLALGGLAFLRLGGAPGQHAPRQASQPHSDRSRRKG